MPAKKSTALAVADQAAALARTETETAKALGIPLGLFDVKVEGDVMAQIVAQIAAAGSVEDALKLGVAEGLQDFDGYALTFLGSHFQPSKYDASETAWPYVVMQAVDGNGEAHTITSGSHPVVTLMALASKERSFPFDARVKVTEFEGPNGEKRSTTHLIAV